jgi:purine-binding chemotaxis protein CheW
MQHQLSDSIQQSSARKYLTFMIDGVSYGLPIHLVQEVITVVPITNIPDVAPHVLGIINLRGRVVPVIDARLRFGLEQRPDSEDTCIIVLLHPSGTIGLRVDAISEVQDIPESQIEGTPGGVPLGTRSLVAGMGKLGDCVHLLLDPETLTLDQTPATSAASRTVPDALPTRSALATATGSSMEDAFRRAIGDS